MWQALVTAFCFLTITPVPARWMAGTGDADSQGCSLYFYPLVGSFIGVMLLGAYWLTLSFGANLQAVLIITVWVILTGALHLDGVADSADAWLGGHGDRERTLKILRDTAVGVAGVVAIVLTLVMKIAILAELQHYKIAALLIAPVIGRAIVLLLFMTTRYARPEGLGRALSEGMQKKWLTLVLLFIALIVLLVMRVPALVMLSCVLFGFLVLRYLMVRRLGGTTGDTAGALIEFTEILTLFGLLLAETLL